VYTHRSLLRDWVSELPAKSKNPRIIDCTPPQNILGFFSVFIFVAGTLGNASSFPPFQALEHHAVLVISDFCCDINELCAFLRY
jgi:hypothetical protein